MELATAVALLFIIIGLILLIVEATMPGVFMIIPAVIFIIIGGLGLFEPDLLFTWYAVALAIVVAIPVTLLTVYAYRFLGKPEPPSTTITDTLVGEMGVVTVDTVPGTLKGKVRIGTDTWSANSEIPLRAGTRVKVIKSEGVHVFIEPEK
ncbi:MAG: inner membrane protein [Candidatus Methanomethylophilaceae archaeon]|nr:inner membrane protein [Candidatus Methanomethylophilaceae archaeon]